MPGAASRLDAPRFSAFPGAQVWKTRMGRFRSEGAVEAFKNVYARGGVRCVRLFGQRRRTQCALSAAGHSRSLAYPAHSAFWAGLDAKMVECVSLLHSRLAAACYCLR